MAHGVYRIGIVGASSLAGKELTDVLSESQLGASDFVLLDDEALIGKITAAGDEIAVIQQLDASSFERMDFAFFTNSADMAAANWQSARKAGASIVDLTYALEGQKDVLVLSPWVEEALAGKGTPGRTMPDLGTPAVVTAHPAAVILALLAARLKSVGLIHLAATVMEPASEYGRPAMDELHQQTVNLLSFQTLPKEQYDAQVSFNLLPALGEAAKIKLAATQQRIVEQYEVMAAGRLPELTVQVVHAPVFHGYVASVLIELEYPAMVTQVEAALAGAHVDVVTIKSDPPSNLSAAGQENILVQVTKATADEGAARRFWVWLAADNLKLHMLNAVACAQELRRLRPQSKVQ
ncbi:Asd/ArgC dimerization domain-containing protein [Granulicella arctica]|uniref:Aspartate-semialdehyde dehydrogenase n=1 Tax=Granulicella arctica TaxID=940613 RepID=A0A7Y9TL54_9BACT|nr:Asd/ArgC dimerization domain-containing protein [Granulicella arctica]NYF79812.1 aspartate-semialdehyde dehydrogenase [Granulicella arctica]